MFVAQPTNLVAENDESWDGNISAIRSNMQEILDENQLGVNKRIAQVRSEMNATNEKITRIDDKLDRILQEIH